MIITKLKPLIKTKCYNLKVRDSISTQMTDKASCFSLYWMKRVDISVWFQVVSSISFTVGDVNEPPYDLHLTSSNAPIQFPDDKPKVKENAKGRQKGYPIDHMMNWLIWLIDLIYCVFVCLFVWGFTSYSRILYSYGDVTNTSEGLQILAYTMHSWPLSSEGSSTYHTYYDKGNLL